MPVLRLVIENVTNLPDGGPISFEVRGSRGIDIGRDQHLDWTLPDTERFISGKHCEIRFRQGGYWLHDVSSNGTFVNGSDKRPAEPYRLRNGDRLEIGPYNIAVTVEEDEEEAIEAFETPPEQPVRSLWDANDEAAAPVPAGMIRPPGQGRNQGPDFLDWHAELPRVEPPPPPPVEKIPDPPPGPASQPPARDPWRLTTFEPQPGPVDHDRPRDLNSGPVVDQPFIPQAEFSTSDPSLPHEQDPAKEPVAAPDTAPNAGASPPEDVQGPAAEIEPSKPPVAPETPEARVAQADLEAFLSVFGEETGVPATMFDGQDPEELARRIGRFMRLSVEGLQQLLRARAQSRGLVRSGGQTMVQSAENNPLKFLPGAEDVLRVLMGPPVNSFLDAETTLTNSFEDLSSHQVATYAAMQQALQSVLEDLEPTAIEQSVETESGLERIMSRRKARLWDRYTERWKARTEKHDNGMTDEFMLRFGEAYERNVRKLR